MTVEGAGAITAPGQRVELSRSAGGRYYWRITVDGPPEEAARRAAEADGWLREHYGQRYAPDPEPET